MSVNNRKVAKNIIFSALSEGSNVFLFLLLIMAARYLGDVEFGKYCFALSFVNLFMMLGDWGVSYSTTIQISRDRSTAKFFLGNLLGLQAATGILIFSLIAFLAWILKLSPNIKLILYLQTFVLIAKTYKIGFRWMFKAFERFDLEAFTLLIERSANFFVGLCVLIAWGQKALVPFVATFLVVKIADAILSGFILKFKVIFSRPRFQPAEWLRLVRNGLPFVIAYTLQHVFFQIDTIMLKLITTNAEVGWYNAPFRIIEGLLVVPCVISYALIPTLSQAHLISRESVTGLFRRGSKYMLLMSIPLILFVWTFTETLILRIFGAQYLPAVPVFRILITSTAFIFISHLSTTVLYCIDRQKYVIWASIASVFVNIILNAILIPRYGILGAGSATFVTQALFVMLTLIILRKLDYKLKWPGILWKPITGGIACAGVFFFTHNWGLFLSTITAGISYLIVLTLLGTWDTNEIEIIKGLATSLQMKRKSS
ncbi:MAG: flippase [Candidatus Theseobacter exili]|nr:flippase [Candidatus Theseobacter exili]